MKKKLLILDFCETLVFAQTADDFIDFITKKKIFRRLIFNSVIFAVYLKIINFINLFFKTKISLKDLLTLSLIGIKETELYEYGKLYANSRLYKISKVNVILCT